MSDMQDNPFITEDLTHATQLAEHAVAQATLALAYEQRTATLVHFLDHLCRLKAHEATEINDIVLKRLGLRDV